MTSKNILLYGAMLFLLLVTLCSAYFLDRYNPLIHTVNIPQISDCEIATLPSGEDPFIQSIPIDILSDTNLTQPEKRSDTNASLPAKAPVPRVIPAKIDYTLVKKEEKAASSRTKTPANHMTAATVPPQKRIRTKSRKEPQKRIVIEPVVLTKTMQVSASGKLYRWDKPFLSDIVQKLKRDKNLYVTITSAHTGNADRRYIQNLRRYLISHNIPKNRIRIRIAPTKSRTKIIPSDSSGHTIELSLIERI